MNVDLKSFKIRPYRSKRLKTYYSQMSHDNLKVIVDDNVKDALLAQGFSVDEAPRSVYKVEKLFEALSNYAPNKHQKPISDRDFDAGVALGYKCFAKPDEYPYLSALNFTPDSIVKVTSNPTGSPGLTNYGSTKAQSATRALERGMQTLKGLKQPEPCLAFKRTQFNDKTRLVWGYPYSMTAIEGLLAYPLLEEFKKGTTPMAFSMRTGALGTKLRVASYHREWAYSLDMSQFDATLSATLIHIAFKILRTWFVGEHIEAISGKTYHEIFDIIERYFIHTPIVMPDGNLYIGKNHGVPSGSYFTQIIDSICNVIIAGTISSRFHLDVSRREIFVLGDDILMWSNRKMDLDKISLYAKEHLGVQLHGSEKSAIYHYDEPIHFLGRDWVDGLPDLPEPEILKRMIYPEKFRRYSSDPVKRRREVEMLLLAFAGTYLKAWRIAYSVICPNATNAMQGGSLADVNVYCRGEPLELNPEHLTGLMRYVLKYHGRQRSGDIPITALQYWL